jgi:deazaflavin-dependent oxidoreductase (nitroreductase family)
MMGHMRLLTWLTYWGGVLNRRTGWRLSKLNRRIYSATNGVLGDATPGARVLLLTTTGRRTGRHHTVPLASWAVGRDFIVGAHAGGARMDPEWLRNLRANPGAHVQLKRESFPVEATVLGDQEREVILGQVAEENPAIRFYERRTPRVVPWVRLRRTPC